MISWDQILQNLKELIPMILNILTTFLLGSFLGFSELLQRYRDLKYIFPTKDTKEKKKGERKNRTRLLSYIYVLTNGIVAVTALFLIKYFKEQDVTSFDSFEVGTVIIAGFGGMMILRSSIFLVKHNDKQIEVGLASIVQIYLDAIERNIKNNAASLRVCNIHEIMKDVDFNLAKEELTSLCIEFVDNFTKEDSERLKNKIAEIASFDISNINKSMQLGREIAYYCDEEILRRSIKKLPHILIKDNGETKEEDEFEMRKRRLETDYNN